MQINPNLVAPLSDEISERRFDPREYVLFAQRRWRIAALTAAIIFAIVFARTITQKKIYDAGTKLVVTTKSGGDTGSADDILGSLNSLRQSRNIDTQTEIINDPDLLKKAFRHLDESERVKGFLSSESPPSWSYDIRPKEETDVIQITTHAYTAQAAADFANEITSEYRIEDVKFNQGAASNASEYVEKEKERTFALLEKASDALSKLQESTKLVAPSAQVSAYAGSEIDLESQLADAKNAATAAADRSSALRSQLGNAQKYIDFEKQIARNPEFDQVQTQLVQLEAQLVQAKQEYTPNAPEVEDIRAQLKTQQAQLKQITRNYLQSQTVEVNPVRVKLAQDYGDAAVSRIVTRDHLQSVQSELDRVRSLLKTFPEAQRRLAARQQDVDIQTRTYNLLSERYYALQVQEHSSVPNSRIVGVAEPSMIPASPKVGLNLLIGAFLAIALGIAAAVLAEQLDNTLRTPEEAERVTGLAALAFVPEVTSVSDSIVIGQVEPEHSFLESFRLLRSNLEFASPDTPLHFVSVTSASPSEGKSTVSVNLAIAMGMDGKRVLLIDSDLRRPSIHRFIKERNNVGFTSVIQNKSTLQAALKTGVWENVSILSSGPLPPNPTEFLNSSTVRSFLDSLIGQFDMVILDAPPTAGLSDMQIISRYSDQVIVVVSVKNTRRNFLASTTKLLRQADAKVAGLVVNRVNRKMIGYYGYYGYYGYSEKELKSGKSGEIEPVA